MATVPKYSPHYTLADYQQWQGDWELWQGVAVAMSPSPFGRQGVEFYLLADPITKCIHAFQRDVDSGKYVPMPCEEKLSFDLGAECVAELDVRSLFRV